MDNNTSQLLQQLADKLGTTSQYLWGVLVRQAPVSATITIFQILIVLVVGYILYRLHIKFMKKDEDDESMYEKHTEALGIAMIVGLISWVIFVMISFFAISDVINGYFNPEYWALQQILNVVHSTK